MGAQHQLEAKYGLPKKSICVAMTSLLNLRN